MGDNSFGGHLLVVLTLRKREVIRAVLRVTRLDLGNPSVLLLPIVAPRNVLRVEIVPFY